MRREFLMLAKPSTLEEDISGWFASEKIDGMRVFSDGGLSRGDCIANVPWANLGKGDTALATGLWSRYGNPVYAPDWFLDALPACFLDGELNAGRGEFQTTMSVCKKKKPINEEWEKISFAVFGAPNTTQLFAGGEIKVPNFEHTINHDECMEYIGRRSFPGFETFGSQWGLLTFDMELAWLADHLSECRENICYLHHQKELSSDNDEAWAMAHKENKKILELGGEGVMLRNPQQGWVCKRVSNLLKVKPTFDAEATVVGATAGRVGKTGRYLGMMGNLIVTYNGITFELSGFNNEEREINDPVLQLWCIDNPGKEMPREMLEDGALQFCLEDSITFLYRELSKSGTPKDARFFRVRPQE